MSTCVSRRESERCVEPEMVYRWPGHVVVGRKTGDWKCPVEQCEYAGVLVTLESLGKHLVSHGGVVDEQGTIEEGARRYGSYGRLKTE